MELLEQEWSPGLLNQQKRDPVFDSPEGLAAFRSEKVTLYRTFPSFLHHFVRHQAFGRFATVQSLECRSRPGEFANTLETFIISFSA